LRLWGWGKKDSDSDSESDNPTAESTQRLEYLVNQSIEDALVPDETKPIEEDAWTLAPSPGRVRVGATGIVAPEVKQEPAPIASVDNKVIEKQIAEGFDRIEATMGIMEARFTQYDPSNNAGQILPTDDLIVKSDDNDALDESSSNGAQNDEETESTIPEPATTNDLNLLDLYEGSVADINPFLNKRIDHNSTEPMVTMSEITALLLDNLSAPSATLFVEKAVGSSMITKDEGVELMALISLANPEINNNGLEHLPHRTLLMFSAMVEAWRDSQNSI